MGALVRGWALAFCAALVCAPTGVRAEGDEQPAPPHLEAPDRRLGHGLAGRAGGAR